jgi:farnesyl-diphosphate farnesyltransferase
MSTTIDNVEIWSGKDRGDENFPVGSLLIRRDLRRHVHAFYAFARNADDIADSETLAPEDKVARLDVMESVLLGRGEGGSPSALALRNSLAESGVTSRHSIDLLIAFRRDATKLRYANWMELLDYCRFSAMPVGRHVLDLHGESPNTYRPSDALCASLQILNHIQDCAKDLALLDRCYLPLDLLDEHGATLADLRGKRSSPGLRKVFDALLEHCRELNEGSWDLPRRTRNWRLRLETAVIAGLAHSLYLRLRSGDPVRRRVKLGKSDVLISAIGALRFLP